MDRIARFLLCLLSMVMILHVQASGVCLAADEGETLFEIKVFEMTGNSIFTLDKLLDTVEPFTGPGKQAADVEKARDAVEKLYHDAGYPAVMVNIPEQTLNGGVVRLQVIESRIGVVKVTGNRYYTAEMVMKELPSLAPGVIPYLPRVQEEIGRLNRTQDLKVDPVMTPGQELGVIDVELKVEDRLPLHGYMELNNRASHNTKDLRLNAMIRYDNLWQMQHSASLQYQTAPQNTKEVQVFGGSYVLPAPWEKEHQLALYGIWSESDLAFGEGFKVIGKGKIFGARYVMPLPQYRLYAHNITLGLDYKHFEQAIGFTTPGGETTHTPVSYTPLSVFYSSSLPDEWGGVTQFNGGLNLSMRGVGSRESEFELKRFKGMANYLYATVGIQRVQKLPLGMSLFAKADGQISDQPLIDNEQYTAGGMESVRGYMESEATGDNAVHATLEVSFPDPIERYRAGKWLQMNPFIFYDLAKLTVIEPLPGQDRTVRIEGTGAGVRGTMSKYLEYELDWAVALDPTDRVRRNAQRVYFKLKALL